MRASRALLKIIQRRNGTFCHDRFTKSLRSDVFCDVVDNTQFEDGTRGQLNSFKITFENPEQVYLYGSHFVECTSKELQYVKLLADN